MSIQPGFAQRYGPVALVTGASSGIGEQFARTLAELGLDLIVVARRRDRLEALAGELRAKHSVSVEVWGLDLAKRACVEELVDGCAAHDIGLVVCNAAAGAKGLLHEAATESLDTLVDLNCRAPLLIAHAFAARLCARGRGGLLFVGSIEARTPTPYSAPYAASKAFVHSLASGLWGELRSRGVDVLVLEPGATDTEMLPNSGMRKEDIPTPVMTPEAVVREGLEHLSRGPTRIAGRTNRLMVALLSWLPRRIAIRAVGWGMRGAIEKGRGPD